MWRAIWNGTTEVAVKTMKGGKMDRTEFMREADVMKELRHPKLLPLFGTYARSSAPFGVAQWGTLQRCVLEVVHRYAGSGAVSL